MENYEIAIIGTGPAGISAAITAKVRNKKLLLAGSANLSEKLSKAHRIDNYPGLPGVSGADLAANLKKQLDELGIKITDKHAGGIYTFGDHFSIQLDNDFVDAQAVIIAGGIMQGKLLKGENEFLGRGVSYCATCDGRLYQGKKVAVLGYSSEAPEEAEYLSEIVNEVLYFPVKSGVPAERGNIQVLTEIPTAIQGDMKVNTLVTDKSEHKVDCVFVLRDAVPPESLVPGIETDGPHIKVNLQMETNIPGLYACGDIAGKPYQYIKAAGQGNVAALSAVRYLASRGNDTENDQKER